MISALDTNDYKSITFSSMKLYSTRQHPLSAFGFTREESLFCVLCIFTVMTESIFNQQRALHEVMSSLLGDFSTSRIPALDTLQGNEQHKTRESMDASLCKVFLSLTRRFFTRVKRLQNYSLSSFASLHPTSEMDSTRICWCRTLHLCKDNLEGICSHIVSGYMSSDECTSLAYDRLILLITRCICLRLKSLQQISQSSSSPSSSALVQGLLFRIEIAFNSSPNILSKYLKESCEELYAALMHQLGFPFLTSEELAIGSLQQERIEQYVSQLLVPSLPSRLRSQIKENMTDISTIVRVETDIVLRRRLELLSRYISTLELSLGKIKEMITALSELWNFVLDVGAEWEDSFIREKRNRRAKARVEQEVFKDIVALKEMSIRETIEVM